MGSGTRLVSFVGGQAGAWRVEAATTIAGAALPAVTAIDAIEAGEPPAGTWTLRGVVSHARYTHAREQSELRARQAGLGRPEATRAALIPIRKSAAWWDLAHDERRAIFEERSHHIAGTLKYLPAIARRLHHGRDLGEPFDFLTWFEFTPADMPLFDELVAMLRATEEWRYVEREIDLRLYRS
jgi:chlorite dismutase